MTIDKTEIEGVIQEYLNDKHAGTKINNETIVGFFVEVRELRAQDDSMPWQYNSHMKIDISVSTQTRVRKCEKTRIVDLI